MKQLKNVKLIGKQGIHFIGIETLKTEFIRLYLADDVLDDYLLLSMRKVADQLFEDEAYITFWLRKNFKVIINRIFKGKLNPELVSVIAFIDQENITYEDQRCRS